MVNKVVQKSCRSTDRIKSNKLMTSLSISLDMLMTGGIIIRVRTRQFRSLHVSAKSEERKNYRRVNNLNGGSDFCRTRGSSLWQFRSTKKLQGRIRSMRSRLKINDSDSNTSCFLQYINYQLKACWVAARTICGFQSYSSLAVSVKSLATLPFSIEFTD